MSWSSRNFFLKNFGGKNTEKVSGIKVTKSCKRKHLLKFFSKTKKIFLFLNCKREENRDEIFSKKNSRQRAHNTRKERKNERHDENKINFENVKLCDVTVLSCVL